MTELYKNSDTQFNIAFGLQKKSSFDSHYVDPHGYLEWNTRIESNSVIQNT